MAISPGIPQSNGNGRPTATMDTQAVKTATVQSSKDSTVADDKTTKDVNPAEVCESSTSKPPVTLRLTPKQKLALKKKEYKQRTRLKRKTRRETVATDAFTPKRLADPPLDQQPFYNGIPQSHFLTHFPKHPNCPTCRNCRIISKRCGSRPEESIENPPTKFGDLGVGDTMVCAPEEKSREGHQYE